jgi:hypothetical protein
MRQALLSGQWTQATGSSKWKVDPGNSWRPAGNLRQVSSAVVLTQGRWISTTSSGASGNCLQMLKRSPNIRDYTGTCVLSFLASPYSLLGHAVVCRGVPNVSWGERELASLHFRSQDSTH